MGLDEINNPPRVTQQIQQGIEPSTRKPSLRDPVFTDAPGADRFTPNFFLVFNGKTLDDETSALITSVEYEDNEDLFDQLKFTLSGFRRDRNGREVPIPEIVQSESLFSEGNIVWLFGGYFGTETLIGGAEIVKREFNYGLNPSCTIIAYEPLHRMANTFAEKAITYKGMRSSDIVKKIGKRGEYSGAIGGLFNTEFIERLPISTPRAEVQKSGESDYQFLKRLADVRGWHFFTRFDTTKQKFNLFYGPDVDKQKTIFVYEYNPVKSLLPEDTVLDFKPEITTIDQNTEIEIIAVDEKRKQNIGNKKKTFALKDGTLVSDRTFSGNNTDFKQAELRNPAQYRLRAFGISKRIITNRPFKNEGEAKKFAIQWARDQIKNFITGSGTLVGNEQLQSRQVIVFRGLGQTFSGSQSKPAKWYVKKIKHRFSSNNNLTYVNQFDVRKVIDFDPEAGIVANLPAQITEQNRNRAISLLGPLVGG